MLLFVEISAVVASLAVVTIAVATVRALGRLEKATDQVSKLALETQQWIGEAREFTREARESVTTARGTIAPIRGVLERFEARGRGTSTALGFVLGARVGAGISSETWRRHWLPAARHSIASASRASHARPLGTH